MSVYYKEKKENLEKSIESILKQTVATDDFVIVCDGVLTKELDEVLEKYEVQCGQIIHLVRLPSNAGLGAALREGLLQCKNNIVARMDSDDISMPNRMEQELRALRQMQADIVSGTVVEFAGSPKEELSRRVLPETDAQIRKFASRRNPFNHPAVMFRKDKVLEAGSYKDFPFFEDYYLWIRMLSCKCRGYNLQEPVLYMRAGDGMYRRRGGLAYVRQIIRFRWFLFREGYATPLDLFITVAGHSAVALVPSGIRRWFYEKVLR